MIVHERKEDLDQTAKRNINKGRNQQSRIGVGML